MYRLGLADISGLFIPPLIIQRVKVKHVGLSVASNQVEGTSDTNGFLIEVDGENLVADIVPTTGRFLLGSKEVALRKPLFLHNLLPDMEDAMNGETATACSSIDQSFVLLRVHHLHAHVDDVAWREVLTFFALARFIDQVLEGFIDNFEVGIKELDLFQRGNTDS